MLRLVSQEVVSIEAAAQTLFHDEIIDDDTGTLLCLCRSPAALIEQRPIAFE